MSEGVKVYCEECRWFSKNDIAPYPYLTIWKGEPSCDHPDNLRDSWMKKGERRHLPPDLMNKFNTCGLYEVKGCTGK